MKDAFKISTKTIVATGLGAALFAVLFMFVKIPTGIPETQIQTAYGIGAFFAALFGPIAGAAIAFIGHAVSDSVQYGSAWWSWVVEEGSFGKRDVLLFNVFQIIGNAIAWIVVAPVLDIVVYSEPVNLVFTQGVVAAISNAVSMGVIGSLLLLLYSKTKSSKGSLSTED